jgi:putative lipoic acid-binding regulatory protein
MSSLPPAELLEATHEFPDEFVFKAIGTNRDGFVELIVAGIREELSLESDPPYEIRQTSGGRHVSVTVTPRVESAAQVLAIYERIRVVDGLFMLL